MRLRQLTLATLALLLLAACKKNSSTEPTGDARIVRTTGSAGGA